jgi:hypothetical protein
MACPGSVVWDGRRWTPGQLFHVPPRPERECAGFSGVLLNLYPSAISALLVFVDHDGDDVAYVTVWPGDLRPGRES